MTWNRRRFLSTSGAAAVGLAAARSAKPAAAAPASRSAALFLTEDDGLKPATYDRLPLEWHQARLKLLQSQLAEDGYAGILLSDPMNIIYFTGLFFTSTERPFRVYLPADRLAAIWFHPGIDRDSVKSWWATEQEIYFDFPHADGGFPNEGKVQQGATVDNFEWTLQGLKKRGLDGKRLATDWELSRRQLATAGKVFVKDTKIDSVADRCEKMRMVKTPEELALWRRAYRVFDETHAYARDLLLEKGTDLTDYELGAAATAWGTNRLMETIKRDGGSHTAVGIEMDIGVRVFLCTVYS